MRCLLRSHPGSTRLIEERTAVSPKLVRSQPGRSRLAAAAIVVLLTAFALSAVAMPATAAGEPNDTSPTLVSLTFDDGFSSQVTAQRLLAQHHMKGTFFIPSGFIGLEGRLTLEQIKSIQDEGNEIGGHTVNHLHLPMLDPTEQARQICDDRVALARKGFTVTSFAYPFASLDPRTEEIVKDCGYNSARSEEGLSKEGACESCRSGNRSLLPIPMRFARRLRSRRRHNLLDKAADHRCAKPWRRMGACCLS